MASFKSFGQVGGKKFRNDQVVIDVLDLGATGYWLRVQRLDKAGNVLASSLGFANETLQAGIKFTDVSSKDGTVFSEMETTNGRWGIIRDNKKENVDIFYSGQPAVTPTGFVKQDGSLPLTADWDIGDGFKIKADEIAARDGDGLKLYEDGGAGLFVQDGGFVGIGTDNPVTVLDIKASLAAQNFFQLRSNADDELLYISSNANKDPLFKLSSVSSNAEVQLEPEGISHFRAKAGVTQDILNILNNAGTEIIKLGKDSEDGTISINFNNGAPKILLNSAGTSYLLNHLALGSTSADTDLHVKGANDLFNGQAKVESTGNDAMLVLWNAAGEEDYGYGAINMSQETNKQGMRFLLNSDDKMIIAANGKVGIGTLLPSANADLTLEGGVLNLKEASTPSPDTAYGKLYTKSDNNLYFQSGAGTEYLGTKTIIKTDTGDPTGEEGLVVINTFDNNIKIYADGAYRQIATW